MASKNQTKDRLGRPRSEASTDAIITAALSLLEEKGYPSLTIEAIASKAGVGKSTIYRWWASKELLIIDIFLRITTSELKYDEGLPLSDFFVEILSSLTNIFNSTLGYTTLSIVAQYPADSDIALEFYNTYLKPNRIACEQILLDAIEKGKVDKDIQTNIILDLLFGPIYFRVLVYKDVPSKLYIKNLVAQVLDPILVS